ncbi:MAG TPA: YoaK family protein [Terriglobales bacterium]|nr:YoaK family protein [Terriglobales bacterium]
MASTTSSSTPTERVTLLTEANRDIMILLLAWAAGSVDAISYLALGHVFTANMTGNTMLMGMNAGQGHHAEALRSATALVGYLFGVAVGALLAKGGDKREKWTAGVTVTLALETLVLGAFGLAWYFTGAAEPSKPWYTLIAASGMTMGLQSVAVRQLGIPGIVTTYITGTLTSLVSGFVSHFRKVKFASEGGTTQGSSGTAWEKKELLQLGVFVIDVCAAFTVGAMHSQHSFLMTVSPFVALAIVVINAVAHQKQLAVSS